jgi:hypothetical protein
MIKQSWSRQNKKKIMPDDLIQFESEPEVDAHALMRENDGVRARLALQMLKAARDNMNHVIQLLEGGDSSSAVRQMVDFAANRKKTESELDDAGGKMLEGVFDGEAMVGADGLRYPVPENYASKSKLVEGDILKLIIRPDGTQVFKQIGPIERKRIGGKLAVDSSTHENVVVCGQDVYKVLAASVSYYKAIPGDEIVALVPSGGGSAWAAVESVGK